MARLLQAVVALLLLLAISLAVFLNSNTVRLSILHTIGETVQAPITLGAVEWEWNGDLTLLDLQVDLESGSSLIIEQVELSGLTALLRHDWLPQLSVALSGVKGHVYLETDHQGVSSFPLPVPQMLAELPGLSADTQLTLRAERVNLVVDGIQDRERVSFLNGEVVATLDNLSDKPLRFTVVGGVSTGNVDPVLAELGGELVLIDETARFDGQLALTENDGSLSMPLLSSRLSGSGGGGQISILVEDLAVAPQRVVHHFSTLLPEPVQTTGIEYLTARQVHLNQRGSASADSKYWSIQVDSLQLSGERERVTVGEFSLGMDDFSVAIQKLLLKKEEKIQVQLASGAIDVGELVIDGEEMISLHNLNLQLATMEGSGQLNQNGEPYGAILEGEHQLRIDLLDSRILGTMDAIADHSRFRVQQPVEDSQPWRVNIETQGEISLSGDTVLHHLLPQSEKLAQSGGGSLSWNGVLRSSQKIEATETLYEKMQLLQQIASRMRIDLSLHSTEIDGVTINTPLPMVVTVDGQAQTIHLQGDLELSLPELDEPLTLAMELALNELDQLKGRQSLTATTLPYRENGRFDLTGVAPLLRKKELPELQQMLERLKGEGALTVSLSTDQPQQLPHGKWMVKGDLTTALQFDLPGDDSLRATLVLNTNEDQEGVEITHPSGITMKGVESSLKINKQWRLSKKESALNLMDSPLYQGISMQFVNELMRNQTEDHAVPQSRVSLFQESLLSQSFRATPSLALKQMVVEGEKARFEAAESSVGLSFHNREILLRPVDLKMMGGRVTGAVELLNKKEGAQWRGGSSDQQWLSRLRFDFYHLAPEQLAKEFHLGEKESSSSSQETMSGTVEIVAPLHRNYETWLSELEGTIHLGHVGENSLDQILYLLDPQGKDESLVQFRKSLQKGRVRWLNITLKHGNLTVDGELEVSGNLVYLPPIQRINIAALDDLLRMANLEQNMNQLLDLLQMISKEQLFPTQHEASNG